MNRIKYIAVNDVTQAVEQMGALPNAKFIAGGTNLLDLMKINVMNPDHLIDINQVGFNSIEQLEDGGVNLGALVTNAETAYDENVSKNYPLLSEAMLSAASAQLRNMATNGGNILQRTRCYYFYDTTTPCNKRVPGSGCSAINGFNRLHAILGTTEHCIAVHPSDMAVALTALDAKVNLSGPSGDRQLPITEFLRLPGEHPEMDNHLASNEIITSITLPSPQFSKHYTYLKLRDRPSYAFALVSVAAALKMDGSKIEKARIAIGGVAHKPWRMPEAEALLEGKEANRENFLLAANILMAGAKGYGHNDFKIELARRAVVRALEQSSLKNNL
jgi:xanthine dehydrogenase YagS FAD-binding subunit